MSKKIVFMGTPGFAVPCLEALNNSNHKVISVYSQPASKANRGQKLVKSKIEIFANKFSLNIRTPSNLDNEEEYKFLSSIKPDIGVVVAYGKIIPKKILSIPKHGFLNVHASLLPKWRGAAPIQRSIMNLDKETGISIMKIVEELDAGPIMSQDKIKINENVDSFILSELLSKLGAKSIITAIKKIESNEANFHEQNNKEATYAKKISKKEAEINWNQNAKIILAKINALNPNPGAWFKYKNERYKVWKANLAKGLGEPGKVLDGKLKICCQENAINIIKIQKEGKSIQDIDQFLLGNKIKEGEILV
tara:strand:+ start:2146 stop:3066 length:921 start_codon:yes stop_codon:yes gene_type:complete